jgi:hypothetical protein
VLMVILFISGVELIPRSGRFSMSSSVKTEANCFYGLINPCIHRNWKSLTVLLYDIKSNLN